MMKCQWQRTGSDRWESFRLDVFVIIVPNTDQNALSLRSINCSCSVINGPMGSCERCWTCCPQPFFPLHVCSPSSYAWVSVRCCVEDLSQAVRSCMTLCETVQAGGQIAHTVHPKACAAFTTLNLLSTVLPEEHTVLRWHSERHMMAQLFW